MIRTSDVCGQPVPVRRTRASEHSGVLIRMMTLAFNNKAEKDLKRAYQTTAMIRFVGELERMMDQHDELKPLAKLPGYEVMKQFKSPLHIVEITNQDATGAADFRRRGSLVAGGLDMRSRPTRSGRPRQQPETLLVCSPR